MEKYIKTSNIKPVNTSESYFSNSIFLGDKWVIPYTNIHISNINNLIKDEPIYKKTQGNYIDKAFLIIEGIEKTSQVYEEYVNFKSKEKVCIGGEHYEIKQMFFETFVSCNKAYLLLPIDYSFSKSFYKIDSNIKSFLNNKNDLYEVIKWLTP